VTDTAIESRLGFIRSGNRPAQNVQAPAGGRDPWFNSLNYPPEEKQEGAEAGLGLDGSSDEKAAVPVLAPDHRPRGIGELGIRRGIVEDLALKTLYLCGALSTRALGEQMRVSVNVAGELVGRLRTDQHCQVTGMAGNIPTVVLTEQGRKRALDLMSQSQYTGSAPVSLESYVAQVKRQSVRHMVVRKADVERAFGDLEIDSRVLGQIGTGLNSGSSIFVHGPAGVGKTLIAETMSRVLAEDNVWIPNAVEVDGQMITVFDPMIHKQVDGPETENCDDRWVRCQRPSVLVGGELTIEMLDLQFNPSAKFYTGPVQMKANNGVLILDDFGRQRVRPEELLNRWVVPLDRGIDFLTLVGGRKIEIPFEMLVVFATNMDPADLVDPAFLRRMQTKIRVDAATPIQFRRIFCAVAERRGFAVDDDALDELIVTIRDHLKQELRACQPRDLVNQVCWAAQYEGRDPILDRASLMAAVEVYFLTKP
jgi:hypothetical protein